MLSLCCQLPGQNHIFTISWSLSSSTSKLQMCFLTCAVNSLNFWGTDWRAVQHWLAAVYGAWSLVIACFVTFPCKLRLMALINFQGSHHYSVRRWLFDIVPISHSDKDNWFKLALGYWLLRFNRRANDKVVACLEMTLQSATIRHPFTAITLLTSVVWHCASSCISTKHETAQFCAS